MVYNMENPIKMDDLGGPPTPIFGNTQIVLALEVLASSSSLGVPTLATF